jgi:hypothetical protein
VKPIRTLWTFLDVVLDDDLDPNLDVDGNVDF